MARAAAARRRRLLGLALLLLVLFAAVVEGGKKGGKAKKGKKGKKAARKKAAGEHPITNDAMPCVACRRMLGHLESSLADAFNKMDAQVMREQERAAASGSQFDPTVTQGKKQQLLERHPVVEGALGSVCGATGLMRPELGTTCERILEDYRDDFEDVLVRHEEFKGRAGLAEQLCGPKVSGVCPADAEWHSKGFVMAPPVEDQSFRSERIPRSEDQPGLSGAGIFKLVGRTVVNAVAEEGKDVFIHFRKPGSEFDKLYHESWTRFGKLVAGTELSDTLTLGEIDVDANDLPAGPPVGGEYIEAACFVFYPAERKYSPTYVLLHTDPDKSVRHKGADFFWQWAHVHGMAATKRAVEELAVDRPMSGIKPPPPPPTPQAQLSGKRKKKKPKHKDENAMVIPRQRPNYKAAVRPKEYDRDSVLTPELVCSACAVVIDEIEYRLRLLKNVAPVVGRRLGADGSGLAKRLNPGRNEVNVADAIEHACDLAQEYSVSGTGLGQRWVRINAREAGESILIESATVEAESPQKLTTACSAFLEKYEDELWRELLIADPDASIQDEFCMAYVPECNGAIFDQSKKPSKLYPAGYNDVPDVVKEEYREDALPLSGGLGAGAVSAGALPHDRLPSRKQLAAAASEKDGGDSSGGREAIQAATAAAEAVSGKKPKVSYKLIPPGTPEHSKLSEEMGKGAESQD